jgi:hypothetical protein
MNYIIMCFLLLLNVPGAINNNPVSLLATGWIAGLIFSMAFLDIREKL